MSYLKCYESGMFILDPDFYPFRIRYTGSKNRNKKRRGKKLLSYCTFFLSKNVKKFKLFSFSTGTEKSLSLLTNNINVFTQKIATSSQKYVVRIRYPRSGIRKKPIPDPGVKKALDPRSESTRLLICCSISFC
jgi:hypothetical protein